MPLVTVTCSRRFYPPNEEGVTEKSDGLTPHERFTLELVTYLPQYMVNNRQDLGLDPGTPVEAVQVDIHRFHAAARNSVDIWLEIRMTEELDSKERCQEGRDVMIPFVTTRRSSRFGDSGSFSWALDMFYGSVGTGAISTEDGHQIAIQW